MSSEARTRATPRRSALTWFAACALAAGCGEAASLDDTSPEHDVLAIQKGEPTSEHPAVGLLGLDGGDDDCTATLIDPSWIVTARHCQDFRAFSVGTDARNFIVHPLGRDRWQQGPENEVTLIKLAQPIRDVPVIPLTSNTKPPHGKECTSIGFGWHDEAGVRSRGEKRKATTYVVSADASKVVTEEGSGFVDGGDSGGPLLCDGQLVGVVATRAGTVGHMGGAYHPIDAAWIREVIANTPPPSPPAPPQRELFSPEVRMLGFAGSLCPADGALFSDNGQLFGELSVPATSRAPQTCTIRLEVTLPPGRKVDTPTVCTIFQTKLANTSTTLTVSYATPGRKPVRAQHVVTNQTVGGSCDALPWSADACSDPTKATKLPITIEVTGRLQPGDALGWSSLDATLAEPTTTWSTCPTEDKRSPWWRR